MHWFATILGIKHHLSLPVGVSTSFCLLTTVSWWEGATSTLISLIFHSLWRDGQNLCGCRGLTPSPAPGWCGIRASPCGSPDAVPEPCEEAEPMEGQANEVVPGSWLPGLDQEQAPGWPSITPAGCWQGWDAHSLLCHLHGLILPQHFQQLFPRLGENLSEQRNKAGHHSACPFTSLPAFPLPWRERAQHRAPVHVQDVLTRTVTHLLPAVSRQQLCGNAGFSSCCVSLSSLSAGPNLSPLYLYANSTVISIP